MTSSREFMRLELEFYLNTCMPSLMKGSILSILLFSHSWINYILVNLKLSSFLYYADGQRLAFGSFILKAYPNVR